MSFISRIFSPEMPTFQSPNMNVPSYDDEQRELEQRRLLEEQEQNRKGRRSTILTGSQGLNEIEDENIRQRTLLGG